MGNCRNLRLCLCVLLFARITGEIATLADAVLQFAQLGHANLWANGVLHLLTAINQQRRSDMDIGRALTFYTEDERWIEKTAIGTGVILLSILLSFILVGVVGFLIVMGYGVRLLQNVRDDVSPVLPEWDQWGDDLSRGFKLFVVQLIWALPIILIVVPITIVTILVGNSGAAAQIVSSFS